MLLLWVDFSGYLFFLRVGLRRAGGSVLTRMMVDRDLPPPLFLPWPRVAGAPKNCTSGVGPRDPGTPLSSRLDSCQKKKKKTRTLTFPAFFQSAADDGSHRIERNILRAPPCVQHDTTSGTSPVKWPSLFSRVVLKPPIFLAGRRKRS